METSFERNMSYILFSSFYTKNSTKNYDLKLIRIIISFFRWRARTSVSSTSRCWRPASRWSDSSTDRTRAPARPAWPLTAPAGRSDPTVSSKTRLHKKQQQPQPLLLHDACRAKHRQTKRHWIKCKKHKERLVLVLWLLMSAHTHTRTILFITIASSFASKVTQTIRITWVHHFFGCGVFKKNCLLGFCFRVSNELFF